jgi:outer membrane protein assembly factor BamD (BamD/ComL family)
VRTPHIASLTWLLAAFLGLLPFHAAHGATMTWNRLTEGEELVLRFDSSQPVAEPRQRGLARIQIPIPWSFWQRERKPAIPDFSSSELLKEASITPDGVFIETRSGDFIFSFSSNKERKELVLEFYPPPLGEPEDAAGAPAVPEGMSSDATRGNNETRTPVNATSAEQEALETQVLTDADETKPPSPLEEESSISGLAAVRSKIQRPGQQELRPDAENQPVTSAVRLPIDRMATPPGQDPDEISRNETLNGTAADQTVADTPRANATEPGQNASAPSSQARQEEPDASTDVTKPVTDIESEPSQVTLKASQSPATTDPVGNVTAITAETIVAPGAAPDTADPPESESATGNLTDLAANASQTDEADQRPPNLEELYAEAQTALLAGDLEAARNAVTRMMRHPDISDSLREELLYTLADITMKESLDDLEGNFLPVLEAYEAAKNSNPDSRNVAEALSRMGYLHIFVGNVPEAKGYFDLLRRKYPDDPRVAMIDYYWGEHYLRRKDYVRAAEHFQYAIQNYPMSLAVQPSTVGLLKAFTAMGYFDKALEIVNSIERRWPRYYLSDPSFLMSAGYAAMLGNSLERARDYFWAYANIVPDAKDVDVAMARIGDILLKEGKLDAAREIYHRTATAHPSREGGLIAKMRLAEEGVLDQPSIADMDPVFSRPASNPEEIYRNILEHADSPLAPVARLKLAMWHLWNKDYAASLEDARRFLTDYPEHELLPKAREVADTALRDWITHAVEQEDFEGATQHWANHEDLYEGREPDPKLRLTVATALMQTGQPQKALNMARPFVFDDTARSEYSEPGMDLTLAMQVELQQWADIVELSKRVEPWNLGQDRRRQLDYATALAHEKLDQPGRARPLWAGLVTDMGLTDTQRGYAHYFLGRDALAAGRLEQATILGQEALSLLRKDKNDIPKLKETLELLAQAAERSGRDQDALAWTLEFDEYVTENDPDWPAHTFRKAILFKKNSENRKWRENLNRLKELFPNSLYGRMAAAELEGTRIEREVQKFR